MALARVAAFGRLIKFSHSIFALPFALAAAALAARAGGRLGPGRLALVVGALAAARTAAMGFNRLVDLRFDRENPRTRTRELVTGAISVRAGAFLTAAAAVLFVALAAALSPACAVLAPIALAVVFGYSYTKRFTWACHLFLGLALAAGPLGAWIAVRGQLGTAALALGLGVGAWVAGFDILYALADVDFDRHAGLRSIPARFGVRGALAISAALHALAVAALASVGRLAHLHAPYAAGVLFIAALLVIEHLLVRPDDLRRLDAAFFTVNGWVSVAFLGFVLLDLVVY